MYGLGGLGQVEVGERRRRAKWLEKITEVMQEDYGGYAGRLRRLCTEKEKARERSVPDGSDKHYELNRGVRRLLTRCGLHKFHWSWWGWFNFSCTKRERTNDWATRTRGFVMERECKKYFFQDVRKKWKFWHQCSTIFNSCVVKASYRFQRWTGQFCDSTKVVVIQKHFTSAHVLS